LEKAKALKILNQTIVSCRKCARLVRYREQVAQTKRRAYRDWDYWGKPVPGFGDPHGELLILGLAPAAHGGNRTGRVFTGDRSGDFLYRMLYRAGFANQPTSFHCEDGLRLRNAYVTAAIRCAPPENKPLPREISNCQAYLEAELDLVRPRAVLALGKIAFDSYLQVLRNRGRLPARPEGLEGRKPFRFRHGASYRLGGNLPRLFAAYHPSQRNTQTGRLTPAMFHGVLRKIRRFLWQRAR